MITHNNIFHRNKKNNIQRGIDEKSPRMYYFFIYMINTYIIAIYILYNDLQSKHDNL